MRCMVCGQEIRVMIFRNDGLCSVNCRKKWEEKQWKERVSV